MITPTPINAGCDESFMNKRFSISSSIYHSDYSAQPTNSVIIRPKGSPVAYKNVFFPFLPKILGFFLQKYPGIA